MNFEKRQKNLCLMMLIVDLSNQAQEHGILSLEKRIPSLKSDFLKKAIHYLVEGFDEKELGNRLSDEFYYKGEFGTERLERQLIKQGVIWILSGEYGKSLFEKLLTVLGKEFFDYIDDNWLNEEEGALLMKEDYLVLIEREHYTIKISHRKEGHHTCVYRIVTSSIHTIIESSQAKIVWRLVKTFQLYSNNFDELQKIMINKDIIEIVGRLGVSKSYIGKILTSEEW